MNKRANWTLPAILGFFALCLIVIPLASPDVSNWWILLGIIFLILAFAAHGMR